MKSKGKAAVFLIVVILGAIAGALFFISAKPREESTVVIVWGWNESEVRQVLLDFFGLYDIRTGDQLLDGILSHEQDFIEFKLTAEFDTKKTFYLVNYFSYPHSLNLKGRIVGAIALASTLDTGEMAMPVEGIVYVPEHDREYDQVYVRDAKEAVYRVSFTNFLWERKANPRFPRRGQYALQNR